jgi:uncharacterized protein with von Willebrand factor type A (vWA) domain
MTDKLELKPVRALAKKRVTKLNVMDRQFGKRVTITPAEPVTGGDPETDLLADTFWQMYKLRPELMDDDDIPQDRAINHRLLKWAQGNQGYEDARKKVVVNLPASIASSKLLHHHLMSDDVYQDALKAQKEADEQAKLAQQHKNASQMLADVDPSKSERHARQAEQHQAKRDEAIGRAMAAMDAVEGDEMSRAVLHAACKQAGDKGKEVADSVKGWGIEEGSPVLNDPSAAQEFANLNTDKLQKIAEYLGRLRGISLSTLEQTRQKGIMPTGAEMTRNFPQMFVEELAQLSSGVPTVLQTRQWIRWSETGLNGWKMTGTGEKAGNFYALVDESASMRGLDEIIAKGAILGICQSAMADGRKYRIGAFSSWTDIRPLYSEQDWKAHMQWAAQFQSGGTDFNYALKWAMDAMEADSDGMEAADVLILTDGWGAVSETVANRWMSIREQYSTRLFYVPVCSEDEIRDNDTLANLADVTMPLNSMDGNGETIAQQVSRWLHKRGQI